MKDKTYQFFIKAVAFIILVASILMALYIAANRNAGHNLPLSDWENTLEIGNVLFTLITIGLVIGIYYLYRKTNNND